MRLWHEYTKNTIHGKNTLCLEYEMQGSHTKPGERGGEQRKIVNRERLKLQFGAKHLLCEVA